MSIRSAVSVTNLAWAIKRELDPAVSVSARELAFMYRVEVTLSASWWRRRRRGWARRQLQRAVEVAALEAPANMLVRVSWA